MDPIKKKGFFSRFFSNMKADNHKDLNNRELAVAIHGKESYCKIKPNQHVNLQWAVKN